MRIIGSALVVMCIAAIVCGMQKLLNEQNCLTRWFVDEDVLCKDCVLNYGNECLDCNSTQCTNCTDGYFWASENNTALGIVAVNETRCRTC